MLTSSSGCCRRIIPKRTTDRSWSRDPPTGAEPNLLAKRREETASDDGSPADEGVPTKGSGWRGRGEPKQVESGHTAREHCDGQCWNHLGDGLSHSPVSTLLEMAICCCVFPQLLRTTFAQ